MKNEMARKGLYIGLGAGMVLFVMSGLLPGSFIGGAIGVDIARFIAGSSLEASLLSRLIVGLSMVFGVMVSGVFFLVCTSSLGWMIGYLMNAARSGSTVEETAVDGKDKTMS